MRSRRSLSIKATVALVLVSGALPILVAACDKKDHPVAIDAGPPPVPTDAAPVQLQPMDEDTGAPVPDAAVAVVHHPSGPGLSLNQQRAKECCTALKKQAGTDPLLAGIVAQCNTIAMQMGPSAGGQAPEFAPLRNFLKGKNMPAMCQGL